MTKLRPRTPAEQTAEIYDLSTAIIAVVIDYLGKLGIDNPQAPEVITMAYTRAVGHMIADHLRSPGTAGLAWMLLGRHIMELPDFIRTRAKSPTGVLSAMPVPTETKQ